MSTGIWTLRGVDKEARKAAKSAAASAGTTIGAWMANAIWKQCARERAAISLEPVAIETPEQAEAVGLKISKPVPEDQVVAIAPGADIEPKAPPPEKEAARTRHRESRRSASNVAKKHCEHGITAGFNCWKCGGLAVIKP